VLERALKATDKSPPTAILIEMGGKDEKPADWSGNTTIQGAKVVHREGWRFRKDDKLTEPPLGWVAKSHYSIRAPADVPVKKMEGVGPVGVVMHLADIKDDAVLTVQAGAENNPKKFPEESVGRRNRPVVGRTALVRRVSTATPVATGPTENDHPPPTAPMEHCGWHTPVTRCATRSARSKPSR